MTDSEFYLQAYWTPECFARFAKQYPETKVHKLRDFFLKVDKWSLQLVAVPYQESFSSYLNLECRFVLEEVSLLKGHKVEFDRFKVANLYRDSDIMLAIQGFLRRQQLLALQPALATAL